MLDKLSQLFALLLIKDKPYIISSDINVLIAINLKVVTRLVIDIKLEVCNVEEAAVLV